LCKITQLSGHAPEEYCTLYLLVCRTSTNPCTLWRVRHVSVGRLGTLAGRAPGDIRTRPPADVRDQAFDRAVCAGLARLSRPPNRTMQTPIHAMATRWPASTSLG